MLSYIVDHAVSTICCKEISRESDSESMVSGIADHTASTSIADPQTSIDAVLENQPAVEEIT